MKTLIPFTRIRKGSLAAQVRNANIILHSLIIAGTLIVVVVLYNSDLLPNIAHLVPLLITLLAAVVLYVVGQTVLIDRFLIAPLDRLTRDITKRETDDSAIFGSDRDDEIGLLARTIRDSTQAIQHRDKILSAANSSAALLLRALDDEKLEASVLECMAAIGRCMDLDRVHIWRIETVEEGVRIVHRHEWLSEIGLQKIPMDIGMKLPYNVQPEWASVFTDGGIISGPTSSHTELEREFLKTFEIQSLVIIPLKVQDQFWGFFSVDDCHREREFSADEISIIHSVGLMIASSVLRKKMTQDIQDTAAKLEAVISNYSGIIWSVNEDNVITLLNGLYIKALGLAPASLEGWTLDDAQRSNPRLGIVANVRKTFEEGPQDWIAEANGRMFHAHNTPIFDESDRVTGVVGSIDDITEIARLQDDLEAALKEAQDASLAKSNFLAKMSHEMRTPLNAVIGLSNLTLEGGGLGDEAYSNVEKVYNAGITLLSTVNDILDISKIEAGKLELVPVEYELPSLINDTINQSIVYIGENPIQFVLNIDESLPAHLYGDELRIKQILNNLLSNAFKYTRKGTVELGLKCQRDGDTVMVLASVRDTGIGIQPENIGKLFDDYSQMDKVANRRIMGTGLGLPITKRLVELMGGFISVESEYGKGSVFTAQIPQRFVGEAVIGQEVADNLKGFHYSEKNRQRNSALARIKLPYARVLVVDDVPVNLDVVKGLMKPYGMHIDCVTSGQEAIDAVRDSARDAAVRYNAVFMDHMMPGMDGIEAARHIREIGTDYAKAVPIIALTANALVGNEEMFLSNGFQAFLSKPIEIPHLDAVIRTWVRDKEQEKSLPPEADAQGGAAQEEGERSIERQIIGKVVPGLNIKKGIERLGGNADSYVEVLRSYTTSIPKLLETVRGVREDNLPNYSIVVHGIKGSSWGICADPVGNLAEALEKASKAGDFGFVIANNAPFLEAAEKLVSDIAGLLGGIDSHSTKPRKDKPDEDALQQLRTACEKYDMDGVDAVMAGLESYDYDTDAELVAWLRSNVDLMNLKQVAERLSNRG